jgi:hypothetical protein
MSKRRERREERELGRSARAEHGGALGEMMERGAGSRERDQRRRGLLTSSDLALSMEDLLSAAGARGRERIESDLVQSEWLAARAGPDVRTGLCTNINRTRPLRPLHRSWNQELVRTHF